MISQLLTYLLIAAGIFLFPPTIQVPQDRSTYNEVIGGMRSFNNSRGDLEYDFRVGNSLHFGIVRPDTPNAPISDASIYFYSASFEGDYFAVVSLSDGCVVVRPGQSSSLAKRADLAFVSIRNSKVFRTLEELRSAK